MAIFNGTASNDTLIGTTSDDQLFGLAGDDILKGLEGNDILDGGTGDDTMAGGEGNDRYIVDSYGDVVQEQANEGYDTISASIDFDLNTTLNVEELYLTGTARFGIGNSLDNRIIGNANDNVLFGWLGNDTLAGHGGRDRLYGNQGNDNLNGGANADYLEGGTGNDTYVVENGGDQVIELLNEGIDEVVSFIDYLLPTHVENLQLRNTTRQGVGNSLNNRILGNRGSNVLVGEDGNDSLAGHGGNDRLIGGKGNDQLNAGLGQDYLEGNQGNDTYAVYDALDQVVEQFREGHDTLVAFVDYELPDHVEDLQLRDFAFKGVGNAINNRILGNALDNVLRGREGNDSLSGYGGNDLLEGGDDNDALNGGTDNDILIGNAGQDSLVGGDGADQFTLTSPLDGIDAFVDFSVAQGDEIILYANGFGLAPGGLAASQFTVGTSASSPNHRLIYNAISGALFFDTDGTGGQSQVQLATLSGAPTLGHGDVRVI